MLALLDGDIFAYRCAASAEKDPVEVAIWRARESIEQCLHAVSATEYQVWLSDKRENNFRYAIYPEYKANRTQPKPIHLDAVREYLLSDFKANIASGQEADDALGIAQCTLEQPTIICSIDKDLLQIPGDHYNFVKNEFTWDIDEEDGLRHFYKQILTGDRADNIFGVVGIGPVKAERIISECIDEPDMFVSCLHLYKGDRERLIMNGKVLWIRRKPNEIWEPPNETTISESEGTSASTASAGHDSGDLYRTET